MKTYDIIEAAEFLKVDRTTALDLAGAGELPGAKIGRAWVFLESDLVDYLRDRVRRQTTQRREEAALKLGSLNVTPPGTPAHKGRRRRRPPELLAPGGEAARATSDFTETRRADQVHALAPACDGAWQDRQRTGDDHGGTDIS